MRKSVVSIHELVDLAIGTPECAVNFLILRKLLKIIVKSCCKFDYKFEIDMDNLKAEFVKVESESRSSFGSTQEGSFTSNEYSSYTEKRHHGQDEGSSKRSDSEIGRESEEGVQDKTENEDQEVTSLTKSEEQMESGSINREDINERKEKQKDSKGHTKKDESKGKPPEKHRKRKSFEKLKQKDSGSKKRDNTKHRMSALEEFNKKSENRTCELESHLKELTDRIESITQTIANHLDENHLVEINDAIDKLKQGMENTADQCFEATNTINDQSTQINDILTTINDIQLRKVENEELIDLLSGKADHSFVNDKVSTDQFEETIEELKNVINENTIRMDSSVIETNTSLDEIKEELNTKLFAEEFGTAKTKIYNELIKLTQQQELILAQQNEHVAAGAKMRNLNCFVCNSDVVMLLEQETVPKFRDFKGSLKPIGPIVGSKIAIGENTPKWKNHLLKTKEFTKTSKASRFNSNLGYESGYVKGRNGCMYKGYAGCNCIEAARCGNARTKEGKCCYNPHTNNSKIMSTTNSKAIKEIGDVKASHQEEDISNFITADLQPKMEIKIEVEAKEEAQENAIIETTLTDEAGDPAEVIVEVKKESDLVIDDDTPIDTNNVIEENIAPEELNI